MPEIVELLMNNATRPLLCVFQGNTKREVTNQSELLLFSLVVGLWTWRIVGSCYRGYTPSTAELGRVCMLVLGSADRPAIHEFGYND